MVGGDLNKYSFPLFLTRFILFYSFYSRISMDHNIYSFLWSLLTVQNPYFRASRHGSGKSGEVIDQFFAIFPKMFLSPILCHFPRPSQSGFAVRCHHSEMTWCSWTLAEGSINFHR